MKETLFQRFVAWCYTRYVLRPLMRSGYSVRLSVITDEEADELVEKSQWTQSTKNERIAMYEKMFDTEQ